MEHIHNGCDCYVNFSCSEGVGMGAVEAAMHNKPVIITEYGGASEYVNTPYTISCTLKPIGFDDFLYTLFYIMIFYIFIFIYIC
jgi:glycosyltransferase involved in cell wall biosynthesis